MQVPPFRQGVLGQRSIQEKKNTQANNLLLAGGPTLIGDLFRASSDEGDSKRLLRTLCSYIFINYMKSHNIHSIK